MLYEYGVTRLGENVCVLITSSEADEYKVLKNDYLIVTVWKLIDETFKEIGIPIIKANELLDKIKDDQRIWDLFKNGITCTLRQAKQYGISSFEDGAHIAAAIRPSFDSWREQLLDRKPYTTGSDQLDDVLKDTHGYILFQESLMQYFDWLGVSPAESIGLIKKISKKKIKQSDFDNLEERIKKQWIINTGSEEMFSETWHLVQSCMSYGFCSAHAAATSLDMCYGAYLKVNYPYEYYSVCFNNYVGDKERTNKLTNELEYFGIKLSDIKFRHSNSKYSYDKESHTIFKGMSSIKFVGDNVGEELYALRDNQYDSFIDLLQDISNTSVNSKQLDILIKLDFFSEFGDINYLLKQVECYDKFYGRKQFTISKLQKEGEDIELIKKYCQKQTEKTLKEFDYIGFLKDMTSSMVYSPVSITERMDYQKEYIGYIIYINPNISKRYYYVKDLSVTKSIVNIQLYEIYSGKTQKVKMWTTQYKKNPFDEGDILYLKSVEKKHKKEPTGEINQKTGKKIYKDVPDKFEFWLKNFTIKNDVEEELV